MDIERREYFFEMDRVGVEEGDGDGASPYFLEISWIARSISSRSFGFGVDEPSIGVLDVVVSSFNCLRFFFLFLDFLGVDVDDDCLTA